MHSWGHGGGGLMYFFQKCFIRFHCVGGCWDQTQDFCDFGIGSQTLIITRLDLSQSIQKICKKHSSAKIFFSAYTPFAAEKYTMQLIKKLSIPWYILQSTSLPSSLFTDTEKSRPPYIMWPTPLSSGRVYSWLHPPASLGWESSHSTVARRPAFRLLNGISNIKSVLVHHIKVHEKK